MIVRPKSVKLDKVINQKLLFINCFIQIEFRGDWNSRNLDQQFAKSNPATLLKKTICEIFPKRGMDLPVSEILENKIPAKC